MAGLLIKNLPPDLHRRLKEEAVRHHRSMTRQALVLLEQALSAPTKNTADLLPEPLKPAKPLRAELSWKQYGKRVSNPNNLSLHDCSGGRCKHTA